MKSLTSCATVQQSAGLASLLFLATIAIAAEPTSSSNGSKINIAPVPVAPVIKPVAFVLCSSEGQGADEKCAALGGAQNFTVPGNRTLLIEQITGTCFGDAPNPPPLPERVAISVVTDGTSVEHLLLAQRQNGSNNVYSDDTRLYADPGSTISVDLSTISASNARLCRLSFSGQFVR